APPGFTPFRIA
uniref:[Ala1,Thr6,Ala11]-phyllokinin n=1 Tax=Physalaemus signifer TaxID=364768 RepID=BRK6_PHYSG|nr:RecName: Full=[Ala1,Thr6,Ala11]-phyllokinin [Physalaemus signifer]